MKMAPVAVILSLAVAGCASVYRPEHDRSRRHEQYQDRGREYTLWFGNPLVIRSAPQYVELRLTEVRDSRCPLNTPCIRSGDVSVTIDARFGSRPSNIRRERLRLTIHPGRRHSQPRRTENYEFTLVDVQPYPVAGRRGRYIQTPYAVISVRELHMRMPGPPDRRH